MHCIGGSGGREEIGGRGGAWCRCSPTLNHLTALPSPSAHFWLQPTEPEWRCVQRHITIIAHGTPCTRRRRWPNKIFHVHYSAAGSHMPQMDLWQIWGKVCRSYERPAQLSPLSYNPTTAPCSASKRAPPARKRICCHSHRRMGIMLLHEKSFQTLLNLDMLGMMSNLIFGVFFQIYG